MTIEKSTSELFSEIKNSNELNSFLAKNATDLQHPTIANYLESLLKEKNMDKSTLIEKSGFDRVYIYQILSGKKTAPSRKKLIGLALTLKLTLDETQHLLKYGQENILYPRDREDCILIYAINEHKSVDETNSLLYDLDFDCIT
jgi:Helix-turn-helix.